ncbi:MAG TPA: nucleoside triphosphate pyrophosphohydrolase family protein [Xanthobacteraceae bacterium]|nr:nucleoside triphosphate pyrophosphohydrolase family protein [Xanthobacteraceae bacterium]
MKTPPPTFFIGDYDRLTRETDRFGPNEIAPVLLGLFGEVGGVMAAAKKHRREGSAFVGYRRAVEEEFGDALWYLAALCRRFGIGLDSVLVSATSQQDYARIIAASDVPAGAVSQVSAPPNAGVLDDVLLRLGAAAADLLNVANDSRNVAQKITAFADSFLKSLRAAEVSFAEIADSNVRKVRGRFLDPVASELPTFDQDFGEDERLPDHFEIVIRERSGGRSILEMNGVVIGDPLTDNIADRDGYRFHDVFHFAHASILHWSPTFRALIKRKRKSDLHVDETQDSGRAIVVEEGLSAYVFSHAKQLDFFMGQKSLSFDLLKTVRQFVEGYEVDACPLRLWEDAILQGYDVFRRLRAENGGIVSGSRLRRRLEFRSLGGSR